MINAGIDFSFFKGKLYGMVEGYQKRGKDLLGIVTISIVNGVGTQKLNNVEMNNSGFDMELGSTLRVGQHLRWRGNVNFSYNDNKITKLFRSLYNAGELTGTGSPSYIEGYNANTIWSYRYGGVQGTGPVLYGPNDVPFFVGTGIVGDARSWVERGGVTVAPYTLGLSNTFDIYDFSLGMIFTGKFGHVFRRQGFNYPIQNTNRILPNSRLSEVLNGDPSQILTLPSGNVSATYATWGGQASRLNYLIESANHIRLQEVNLAYNLEQKTIEKLGFSALRIYAQANNLFTITNNKYNEDPEYLLGTINPTPRFTFGFKLQL